MSFDLSKPIAIGSDHAGFEMKMELLSWLKENGYRFNDIGVYENKSVEEGDAAFGILLCGSANGVAMTANKHQGIRAAICWEEEIAKLARSHNNANIVCLPARFISLSLAKNILTIFMNTTFEGGRHQNRVGKIACAIS